MANEIAASEIDVLAVDAQVQRSSDAVGYGLTAGGFLPKPFARLLAEKLALARALFGEDIDLTSASAFRKIFEVSALEDARLWALAARMADDTHVATATGEALSRHGLDLGIPRPYLQAEGIVTLKLTGELPGGTASVTLAAGTRILSEDKLHHAELDETVTLSATAKERIARVVAFFPGPDHNLDPRKEVDGGHPQKLTSWNVDDDKLAALERTDGTRLYDLVGIAHTQALQGGERQWSDRRYRQLLLQAPRSLWTVEAIRLAVARVPGVHRVVVHDRHGGLDLNQAVFDNFNFLDEVFSAERDIASPYFFDILVAPTRGAFWGGPDGLEAAVLGAVEDLRPIGIYPRVRPARLVGVKVAAKLTVKGLPLPAGASDAINASEPARALKRRLLDRLRVVVENGDFGEPVRASEVTWALLNEPGIVDVQALSLWRSPSRGSAGTFTVGQPIATHDVLACGANVTLEGEQVAVFVDDDSGLEIV